MTSNPDPIAVQDFDPEETHEWREAIDVVIERFGEDRAQHLITSTIAQAYEAGIQPQNVNTPYINTIPREKQPE